MSDKKFIIIFAVFTLVILFSGITIISNSTSTPRITASENAKAETQDPTSFDFGNIAYSGSKATKIFTIKNTGSDTLRLFNVKTSCHCTKAHITINGKDSPDFGMSGVSTWVGEVPSGKEAKLTVVFDQSFHGPAGVGPITRFVSVETNDKGNLKITFTLTGTVLK